MSLTWPLQALLVRHEAYMVDAEQERQRMAADIEKLESEKRALEAENARNIEENRGLLNQLEELNNTVAESDTHINALSETLQATQQEVRRLTVLAAQAEHLEAQLSSLEQEQATLQRTLVTTEEEERSAVQRWKNAERTLVSLQEQIERIEKEAREERERHVEIVGRMERRRAVEKELDCAAGRLKSAAAVTTLGRDKSGSNVVSHFVKDILQDNANLQLGIVELRELLMSSTEEVEQLREQLMLHQPVMPRDDDGNTPSTLGKELASEEARTVSQELHFHHHYHAAPKAAETPLKAKGQQHRRPKAKRHAISSGLFTPPSGTQTPSTPSSHYRRPTPPSTAAAILSQTSVSIPDSTPPASNNRWSVQSNQTRSSAALSSVPSSPQSAYRTSSIFDRAFNDNSLDSSRPTSPESNGPDSPVFLPRHRKLGSDASSRSFSTPAAFQLKSASATVGAVTTALDPTAEESDGDVEKTSDLNAEMAEETDPSTNTATAVPSPASPTLETYDEPHDLYSRPTTLRRSASHESLLSISGMDIHTLQSRPSQLLTPHPRGFHPTNPLNISSSGALASNQPVLSAMTATAAHQTRSRYDSSTYNRSLLSGLSGNGQAQAGNRNGNGVEGRNGATSKGTLGRKVSGWFWGRDAATNASANTSSNTAAPSSSASSTHSTASSSSAKSDPSSKEGPSVTALPTVAERAPGVNQFGPVRGLRRAATVAKMRDKAAPPPASDSTGGRERKVMLEEGDVDVGLLRETLAEGALG
ncbi:MAG: hypothetical protein M1819_002344 [Sarea resinae]|nr:MAG: hypothetical protein M1819_002344 [Sarea resinae]